MVFEVEGRDLAAERCGESVSLARVAEGESLGEMGLEDDLCSERREVDRPRPERCEGERPRRRCMDGESATCLCLGDREGEGGREERRKLWYGERKNIEGADKLRGRKEEVSEEFSGRTVRDQIESKGRRIRDNDGQ